MQGYNYSQTGHYFITICVEDGHEMLGTIDVGAATCRPLIELSDIGKIADISINNISAIYPHVFG